MRASLVTILLTSILGVTSACGSGSSSDISTSNPPGEVAAGSGAELRSDAPAGAETLQTRDGPIALSTTPVPELCSLITVAEVNATIGDDRQWVENGVVTDPSLSSDGVLNADQLGPSCIFRPTVDSQGNEIVSLTQITTQGGAEALVQALNLFANNVPISVGDQAFYKSNFPEAIFFRVGADWFYMDVTVAPTGSIDWPRSQAVSQALVALVADHLADRAVND